MNTGYKGMQNPESGASEFNALSFLITQILNKANTSTLVQIKKVTNSGGVSLVGFVDVQPLVGQLDGNGNVMPHGVIYHIPYFRLQGGTDAVILDPKVNDIGLAVFADHDISAVKAAKKAAAPGSGRRFDMADGMYMGGLLNGVPAQYIQFEAAGIKVVSPTKITCEAPIVQVDTTTATVNAATGATVTAPSISLGATGQTLRAFVTSAFEALFNGHTHASSGAGIPNQQMGPTHVTTTVKGG